MENIIAREMHYLQSHFEKINICLSGLRLGELVGCLRIRTFPWTAPRTSARDLNHPSGHSIIFAMRCCGLYTCSDAAASANISQLIKVSGRKRTRHFYLFLITTRAQQYSNYRLRLLFRLGRQKSSMELNPTHTQTSPSESKLHQGGVSKLNDLYAAHSAAARLNDSASEKNLIFHKSNFVLYTRGVIV